ncbi:MAG: class I SAM-dependent methyltransferase [Caulobacterales bacterium]
MNLYDRYVLPCLIGCACGARPIRKQREKIVPQARGVVLELGFGAGHNLPFYQGRQVTQIYGLEPSRGMLRRATKALNATPIPVTILQETAEALSLGPASVDTVLVTYSLCTIPDPISALAAAKSALKPGGQLLFCEHGHAPDASVARAQARIEPFWSVIGGGCHLTRDIPALISGAGYRIDHLDTMYLPNSPKWAGFNYWGQATPA